MIRQAIKAFPGANQALTWAYRTRKLIRHARNVWRSNADIFGRYYEANRWQNGESRSGDGSSLEATAVLRAELPSLLRSLGVRSMLDVPCGDFNWMRHVDLTGIDYLGVDVVAPMIEANNRSHAGPGVRFLTRDATEEPLPTADVVFCRDMLVHLSESAVWRALASFRATGATYLMATTFPSAPRNRKIVTGMWRPLNLQRPPFNFPEPISLIDERWANSAHQKCMGVWRFTDLPEA